MGAETLQTLLRNTEYVSYATSGGRVYNYLDEAEAKFNEVGMHLEEESEWVHHCLSLDHHHTAGVPLSNMAENSIFSGSLSLSFTLDSLRLAYHCHCRCPLRSAPSSRRRP
jgi:hypothetical protein